MLSQKERERIYGEEREKLKKDDRISLVEGLGRMGAEIIVPESLMSDEWKIRRAAREDHMKEKYGL